MKRADMYLSKLEDFIEAKGGRLELYAAVVSRLKSADWRLSKKLASFEQIEARFQREWNRLAKEVRRAQG